MAPLGDSGGGVQWFYVFFAAGCRPPVMRLSYPSLERPSGLMPMASPVAVSQRVGCWSLSRCLPERNRWVLGVHNGTATIRTWNPQCRLTAPAA